MKLTELEPTFVRLEDLNDPKSIIHHVGDLSRAHGILFWCPVCFHTTKAHYVLCWTPEVPLIHSPAPGRWEMLGTGVSDLTLRAGSSSVQLTNGCRAHFFVRDGVIVLC